MRQVCDPGANGDGTGRVTGLVRREIEVFWNDLKRAHWIDAQTRVVAIFLQLKSNHVGVRMRYTMMFELTALGAILPSYDVESRILDKRSTDSDMMLYASIALGMVILFCLLEFVEAFYEGINKYCADMWNVSRPAPKSSDLTPSPSLVRPPVALFGDSPKRAHHNARAARR